MSRITDILNFELFINSRGPSHFCLKCGARFVPTEDGCPYCGMWGVVRPIARETNVRTTEVNVLTELTRTLHMIATLRSAELSSGDEVEILCYKRGCEGVRIPVTLGLEFPINGYSSTLSSGGRLYWWRGSTLRGFELSEHFGGSGYCKCPNCKTLFGNVVVVSDGQIFGYDPEPA
jgi:hypothetical protein